MRRAVAIGVLLFAYVPADAADGFKKLNAAQVRQRLSGMEITDGVHWAELYNKDGSLVQWAMGRKYVGSWTLDRDELCTSIPTRETLCREVWVSPSNRVEFRMPGIDHPQEGQLVKRQARSGVN